MTTVAYYPGVWDLLHVGHLRALEFAKARCDTLIVGCPVDDVVCMDKDKPPVICDVYRFEMLSALSCVDLVVFYDKLEFVTALTFLLPDILCVGQDWGTEQRHQDAQDTLCNVCGGRLLRVPYSTVTSSSQIVARIKGMP